MEQSTMAFLENQLLDARLQLESLFNSEELTVRTADKLIAIGAIIFAVEGMIGNEVAENE